MEEIQDRSIDDVSATPVAEDEEQPRPTWATDPEKDAIIAALRTVEDPEIPVNIYDLGLVYRVDVIGERVEIDMTLTAPGCPVAGDIVGWVRKAVLAVPGVGTAQINLVFDPPWDQSKMSEEAKLELGFF